MTRSLSQGENLAERGPLPNRRGPLVNRQKKVETGTDSGGETRNTSDEQNNQRASPSEKLAALCKTLERATAKRMRTSQTKTVSYYTLPLNYIYILKTFSTVRHLEHSATRTCCTAPRNADTANKKLGVHSSTNLRKANISCPHILQSLQANEAHHTHINLSI